jgi:hypothetical protein
MFAGGASKPSYLGRKYWTPEWGANFAVMRDQRHLRLSKVQKAKRMAHAIRFVISP